MDGWFKIHRKIINNQDLMRNPNLLKLFITLLSICDYKTGVWRGGRFQLARLAYLEIPNTYYTLKRLETLKMLTLESNNRFTTISISKWKEYQADTNNKTNNGLTTDSQQSNNGLTLYKEVRSKNIRSKELDAQQLTKLQIQFPTKSVKQEYDKCKDFIASSGKTYKDYEAMFRNWLRRSADTRIPPPPKNDIILNQKNIDLIQKGKLCIPN